MTVLHLPTAGGTLADDLDHLGNGQTGLFGKVQRFRQALHQPGNGDLVAHLGQLPRAGGPHEPADLGIGGNHRLGPGIVLGITAAHDGKLAVLGPGLSARNRRIYKTQPGFAGQCRQFARDSGRDRGVIDKDRTPVHAGKGASLAPADLPQVIVIADTGHDELCPLGRFARGGGGATLVLADPGLGLGGGAVPDSDLVSGGGKMASHRKAHHSKSQKSHSRHQILLLVTIRRVDPARALPYSPR